VSSPVGQPIGRIVAENGPPSENTRHMMDQARGAAGTILSEVSALAEGDVEAYRQALITAGYTPFGGGS
jgi:hypothetical protein